MSPVLRRALAPAGIVLAIAGTSLSSMSLGPAALHAGLFLAGCAALGAAAILNRRELRAILLGGGVAAGTSTTLYAAVVLGLVVLVNFIANRHHLRYDMTMGKTFGLSEQTKRIVADLDAPVQILGFFKTAEDTASLSIGETARRRLREYGFLSSKIQLSLVDPLTEPGLAARYAVRLDPTIVVARGDRFVQSTGIEEEAITSALLAVTRERRKKVLFLSGHGERLPSREFTGAARALEGLGFEVGEMTLSQEGAVPPDCDVTVIAGPEGSLLPEEETALRAWLEGGGRLLAMTEPLSAGRLDGILQPWGLRSLPMVVADRMSGLRGSIFTPVVTRYEKHAIVQSFGANQTLFPTVGPVEWFETADPLIFHETLARTGADAWAESDLGAVRSGSEPIYESASDRIDPNGLPVAAIAFRRSWQDAASPQAPGEAKEETRIVLFGDADFASDGSWANQWNSNLFLNSVSWLAQEEVLIGARQSEGQERALVPSRRFIRRAFALLVTPPLLVALVGVAVWWRRRTL